MGRPLRRSPILSHLARTVADPAHPHQIQQRATRFTTRSATEESERFGVCPGGPGDCASGPRGLRGGPRGLRGGPRGLCGGPRGLCGGQRGLCGRTKGFARAAQGFVRADKRACAGGPAVCAADKRVCAGGSGDCAGGQRGWSEQTHPFVRASAGLRLFLTSARHPAAAVGKAALSAQPNGKNLLPSDVYGKTVTARQGSDG